MGFFSFLTELFDSNHWTVQFLHPASDLMKQRFICLIFHSQWFPYIYIYILDNSICTGTYNQTMFSVLKFSNKLHVLILEALLITKFKPELCKQSYFICLFCSGIHLGQGKLIPPIPTLLIYGKNFFSFPPLCIATGYNSRLEFLKYHFCGKKFSDEL